jgi:hypothetical protein
MAGDIAMPFGLDSYWLSAPAGILGSKYALEDGRVFRIVKNAEGAVLSPKNILKWTDHSGFTTELSESAGDGPIVAGVVPATYSGKTIPTAATFYVQQRGVTTVTASGATIAVGSLVVCGAGDGKAAVVASAGDSWKAFAVKTDATGASAGDQEIQLDVRGA